MLDMIPRNLEYGKEYVERAREAALQVPEEEDLGEPPYDPSNSGPSLAHDEGDPEPIVMASFGSLMVLGGLCILVFAPVIGVGFVFFGIMMILGSVFSWKLPGNRRSLEQPDDKWDFELSALNDARQKAFDEQMEADSHLRLRNQMRRMEIDEVVKAVKTTIRVRCRYCGTLNEEKAKKCESCGGLL
jgi:hypothetical protein